MFTLDCKTIKENYISRDGPGEKFDQGSNKRTRRDPIDVALSAWLYKHDLVNAAQLSFGLRYYKTPSQTVENRTSTGLKCNSA